MASVELTPFKAGTTITHTAVNASYSTLAAATGAINDDNLASNAVSRAHLVAGTTLLFSDSSVNVASTGTYSSTTYTLVSHGTDMDVPVNIAIADGTVVRCHANLFITTGTQNGADTNAAEFDFKFYWDIGAGYVAMDTMTYRYTYAARDETGLGTVSFYKNRKIGFSLLYIRNGTTVTPASIQVRVSMVSNINSITIGQDSLVVLVQRP